jgi:HK97 family phage portal protein
VTKSLIGKVFNQGPPIQGWRTRATTGTYHAGYGNARTNFLEAVNTQGTLHSIVQLLSTGKQAMGPWQLFRKSTDNRVRYARTDRGSDQRVEVVQHQALKLWNRPNDFMTGSMFREIGWMHMELAGEWYWVLNRGPSGKSVPIEMWPVRPDRMEPVPDKDNFLAGWVYTGPDGEAVPLSTGEVIQLRYPHPTDYYRGLSPVQAILADIDSAKYTAEWSRNFFLNSAQPGGIVTFSKRLTDDEFTEFTDRWREQHQGVARGHRVGVLEQGATWTQNNYSLKEMEFPELRRVTSDMIRQGYRIHQAMLGDSTDVNRANAQTALVIHVAFHEVPRLDREKEMLNTLYLEMFGAESSVEFDYPDPYPEDRAQDNLELKTKVEAAVALIKAGFKAKAALEVVGLPDMPFEAPPLPAPAPKALPGPAEKEVNPQPGPGEAGAGRTSLAPAAQSDKVLEVFPESLLLMITNALSEARNGNGQKETV